MDPSTAVVMATISAAVAAGTAIVKAGWTGDMSRRAIIATVSALTLLLMAAAVVDGSIPGGMLVLVVQFIMQVSAAIGVRELTVAALPGAANLPTRLADDKPAPGT